MTNFSGYVTLPKRSVLGPLRTPSDHYFDQGGQKSYPPLKIDVRAITQKVISRDLSCLKYTMILVCRWPLLFLVHLGQKGGVGGALTLILNFRSGSRTRYLNNVRITTNTVNDRGVWAFKFHGARPKGGWGGHRGPIFSCRPLIFNCNGWAPGRWLSCDIWQS